MLDVLGSGESIMLMREPYMLSSWVLNSDVRYVSCRASMLILRSHRAKLIVFYLLFECCERREPRPLMLRDAALVFLAIFFPFIGDRSVCGWVIVWLLLPISRGPSCASLSAGRGS